MLKATATSTWNVRHPPASESSRHRREEEEEETDLLRWATGGMCSTAVCSRPITSLLDGSSALRSSSGRVRGGGSLGAEWLLRSSLLITSTRPSSSSSRRRRRSAVIWSRPHWYRSICRSTSRSSCTSPGGSMPSRPATLPSSSRHRITFLGWPCNTAFESKHAHQAQVIYIYKTTTRK